MCFNACICTTFYLGSGNHFHTPWIMHIASSVLHTRPCRRTCTHEKLEATTYSRVPAPTPPWLRARCRRCYLPPLCRVAEELNAAWDNCQVPPILLSFPIPNEPCSPLTAHALPIEIYNQASDRHTLRARWAVGAAVPTVSHEGVTAPTAHPAQYDTTFSSLVPASRC